MRQRLWLYRVQGFERSATGQEMKWPWTKKPKAVELPPDVIELRTAVGIVYARLTETLKLEYLGRTWPPLEKEKEDDKV